MIAELGSRAGATRAAIHGMETVWAEWEALADRSRASPFRRPGWMRIWARHFSRAPLQVLCVRRDEKVVALIPFTRRYGVIRSPTNFHTPEFGALAEDAPAAEALFRSLFAQPHHRITLSFLDPSREEPDHFRAAAGGRGERTLARTQQRAPYLELSGLDTDALDARLPARLRGDLRRRERRLREAGEVVLQVADGRAELGPLLAEGFRVEPSEWKATCGTAIESRTDTRSFYRDIAAWAADRGILRLAFLRLDGAPIAFQLGLEDAGAYYFLKGGYDVAFRRFAPGKLLVRDMLTRAVEGGLERFEFLGNMEPWKQEWTTTCRQRVSLSAFGRGPMGYGGWLANRFVRPAVRTLRGSYSRWRASSTRAS